MAEIKTYTGMDKKKRVEIFCSRQELFKVLHYQDPKGFAKIKEGDLTYDEYCLTFNLNKE